MTGVPFRKVHFFVWRNLKMKIKIQSGEKISDDTIREVKDIFAESNCPNESLYHTFDDFTSFDGEVIQFGEGSKFVAYVEVNSATDSE